MKALALLFGAALLLPACSAQPDGGSSPASTLAEAVGPLAAPAPRLKADGLPWGVKPFRGDKKVTSNPTCASPHLTYFGGPLLQSPTIVAVFWSSAVNAAVQANMAQFYADVTKTSYWAMLQEYDSVGLTPGTSQVILPGTSGGGVVIAPQKCNPGGSPCKLGDADVQAELTRQIGMGVLPAPTVDCTGNANTIYMVSFPPNVSLAGAGGQSCVQFCAYHSTGTYGPSNTPLVYAALMDEFTGPCASGCGSNAMPLDNTTSTASHELAEAATDADIGLVTGIGGYALPGGWGDNDNSCGEIGDICDSAASSATVTVSGRSWVVQQLWSNKQHTCAASGPGESICAGTVLTGCRLCGCGDTGGACGGVTPVCETASTNVLFGGCEACTATGGTCPGGTCQQSATPSQDDICPGCTPLTACPTGANCGTLPDGCGGTLHCGTCTAPQTCGGGTPFVPNVCGCTPITSCGLSAKCGTLPDGCGGTITCGTCTPPQTCGGGTPGFPGYCGCTPITACPAGDVCGDVPDGCNTGGVVSCGACGSNQTCVKNQCVTMSTSSSTSSTSSTSSSSTSSTSSSSSSAASTASSSSGAGVGGAGGGSSSGHVGSSGSGGSTPAHSGGCGCKTAGEPAGSPGSSLSALGLLALAGAVRTRRRRPGGSVSAPRPS